MKWPLRLSSHTPMGGTTGPLKVATCRANTPVTQSGELSYISCATFELQDYDQNSARETQLTGVIQEYWPSKLYLPARSRLYRS